MHVLSLCLWPGAISGRQGCLVTTAGADLMQLNDVAKGVANKDLIGILPD
jgi:hypothetical protein